MCNQQEPPKIGVGIRVGAKCTAIERHEHGQYRSIELHHDEQPSPLIDARLRSKEQSWGRNAEMLRQRLSHAHERILATWPDLTEYPQFGGRNRSAADMSLVFTSGTRWGVEQFIAFGEATKAAAFHTFDGFLDDIIAGVRHLAKTAELDVQDGDAILVVNAEAARTYITLVRCFCGAFHRVADASIDNRDREHDFEKALATGISKLLASAALGFANHVILLGEAVCSLDLRQAVAAAAKSHLSNVLGCSHPCRIMARGAADQIAFKHFVPTVLECGFGLTVQDYDLGGRLNRLLVAAGQPIPPVGFYVENSFFTDAGSENGKIFWYPFICKPGMSAAIAPGVDTFVPDSEIVPLERLESDRSAFPSGRHEISVGVRITLDGKCRLSIRAPALPDLAPIRIPLIDKYATNGQEPSAVVQHVLLVLDCSRSMAGDALQLLQTGAEKFIGYAIRRGAQVGIIRFPKEVQGSAPKRAKVLCDFCVDWDRLASVVAELTPLGVATLHEGLRLAKHTVRRVQADTQPIVIVVTSGQSSDPVATAEAAREIKRHARLIAVAIGTSASDQSLAALADSPQDFFLVPSAEHVLPTFAKVVQRVWHPTSTQVRP